MRRSLGEKIHDFHINQHIKHPEKKMFCSCFVYKEVGSLQPFDDIMHTRQYIDVLDKSVVPELNKKRCSDGSEMFQQVHAPYVQNSSGTLGIRI